MNSGKKINLKKLQEQKKIAIKTIMIKFDRKKNSMRINNIYIY